VFSEHPQGETMLTRPEVVIAAAIVATSTLVCQQVTHQWIPATTSQAPPSPRGVAMAHDSFRARVVLFGGCQIDYPQSAIVGASAETWEWDGADWSPRMTAVAPSGRFFHTMAYDSARRRIVMFGGRDALGANPTDTTWDFDGTSWLDVTPSVGPTPREHAGLAYDAARERCVIFGGSTFGGGGNYHDDTWTWDGSQWQQQVPAHSPLARFGHTMQSDAVHQVVLMHGGAISWALATDLWQWDGVDWSEMSIPGSLPMERHYHTSAFDPTHDKLVVFGGDPGGYQAPIGDTWELTSGSWAQNLSVPSPSPRRYAAMAFDAVRREFVLFGGQDLGSGPNGNTADTWVLHTGEGWFATFGSGCGGPGGTPALGAPLGGPRLGQVFRIEVSGLPALAITGIIFGGSSSQDGGGALPRDLASLGMPGCTQWVSTISTDLLLGIGGLASRDISMPNVPILIGMHAYFQAATFTANVPAGNIGVLVSDAACATIGS
jgi:hypothetical protein